MGWNGSGLSKKNNIRTNHSPQHSIFSRNRKFLTVAISVSLISLLGFILFVYQFPSENETDSAIKTLQSKQKKRTSSHKKVVAKSKSHKTNLKKEKETKPWRMEDSIIDKHPNGDFVVKDSKGRKVLIISKESRRIPGEKPLMFTNKFERVLMQFAIPGEDIPPLPDVWTEEDVEEALSRPVNIDMNNDDELTIQRKEGVIMLKELFAKAKANGISSTEFVRELAYRQAMEASLVKETRSQVMQHIIDGDLEMARALQKKFNEHLATKGLPPLKFPKEVIGEDNQATTNNKD